MFTGSDDIEYTRQALDLSDTVVWDRMYAEAGNRANESCFAQLILEHGPGEYRLLGGLATDALRLERLGGAKIHVILDWAA